MRHFSYVCIGDLWNPTNVSPLGLILCASQKVASIVVPKAIVSSKKGVKLFVRAKPGARQSAIVSIDDEAVVVQINAPPREGAANEALVEFLADTIDVKRSKASLEAGGKSRSKIVEVETDQTPEQVYAKLSQHFEEE